MESPQSIRSKITGIAHGIPSKVLTNHDLMKIVDTSDEWIQTRTGIKERRFVDKEKGETHTTLALEAARKALVKANAKAEEIELVICATMSPETYMPMASCRIVGELGAKNAGAFDLNTACSGFISALHTADSFIRSGVHKKVLVIATEVFSSILDWTDRKTCVLFGDGAGAAVVEPHYNADPTTDSVIIGSQLWSMNDLNESLAVKGGASREPDLRPRITMDGQEVFKFASRAMAEAAGHVVKKCGYRLEDVDWFIPHQANLRIIEMVAKLSNFPMEKVYVNLDRWGNTSSATVIIALSEMQEKGLLKKGQLVLLDVFGGGFNYGALLLRW